ncbi:MAG: hypothetical protein P4L10_10935 [Acidobacteriaceae bacterium]|nr:hypothetical protein [Acidobacteriaceae bacterium]
MADEITVTDAGHSFVVGKSGAGAQMRIIRMLGPELSKNDAYVTMATLCSAVTSIDGVPVPKPTKPEHFEALADQIGDSLNKVAEAFKALNGGAATEAEGVEAAKN